MIKIGLYQNIITRRGQKLHERSKKALLFSGSSDSVHMHCQKGETTKITEYSGLPKAMRHLGLEGEFVHCGGDNEFSQEREQWTSGANFFTFAPGQIIGYNHNKETLGALNKAGFEIVSANAIINGEHVIQPSDKIVVAMDGGELSRGGGGCRCMTMPIHRDPVNW